MNLKFDNKKVGLFFTIVGIIVILIRLFDNYNRSQFSINEVGQGFIILILGIAFYSANKKKN